MGDGALRGLARSSTLRVAERRALVPFAVTLGSVFDGVGLTAVFGGGDGMRSLAAYGGLANAPPIESRLKREVPLSLWASGTALG